MFTTTTYHLDSFLDDLLKNTTTTTLDTKLPNRYYQEATPDAYTIEVPMVGMSRDNLTVKVEDNILLVEASTSQKSRFIRNFKQSWTLNEDVDVSNISAKLENGLLLVSIPRIKPVKKSVSIKIN